MSSISQFPVSALLLAAGLGTRLKPLTDTVPKPMVTLLGRPIIDYGLELIARSGIEEVVINLHYLGEQISGYVKDGEKYGLKVSYSPEDQLLDTGGALLRALEKLTNEYIVILNGDTIFGSNFSLEGMLANFIADTSQPLVSVVTSSNYKEPEYSPLLVDASGTVVGARGEVVSQVVAGDKISPQLYQGVMFLRRTVVRYLPSPPKSGEPWPAFSIIGDTMMNVLKAGERVTTYNWSGYWSDLGTPERLAAASKDYS